VDHEQLRLEDAIGTFKVTTPGRRGNLSAEAEISQLQAHGLGRSQISASLNARGIPTPSGRGRWHPSTVYRVTHREEWARYMRHYRRRLE
jgi:hypothetical protein